MALSVEIPIDRYLTGDTNELALLINIIVPPFLMFLLVATIKPPKKENLELVLMEVAKNLYQRDANDIYEVRSPRRRGKAIGAIVSLFYLISFALSMGIIITILLYLQFPFISYFIFIIFISLIAFTGTKIRQRSKEMQVTDEKETFFNTIIDLFAIPIVQFGKWLASRWQRFNFVSAFFGAMIDLPFITFVEFLEQWRYFLKEKKEKIH